MGLDTTHDCWHGGYGSFNQFRRMLAERAELPPLDRMEGFAGLDGISWSDYEDEPLCALLNHSDCDGKIEWRFLGPLAVRLRELDRPSAALRDELGDGWLENKILLFALGCEKAFLAGEDVEFR